MFCALKHQNREPQKVVVWISCNVNGLPALKGDKGNIRCTNTQLCDVMAPSAVCITALRNIYLRRKKCTFTKVRSIYLRPSICLYNNGYILWACAKGMQWGSRIVRAKHAHAINSINGQRVTIDALVATMSDSPARWDYVWRRGSDNNNNNNSFNLIACWLIILRPRAQPDLSRVNPS